MELEKLSSSKFEKFKSNELGELAGAIRGGNVETCTADNHMDSLNTLTPLLPSDLIIFAIVARNPPGTQFFSIAVPANPVPVINSSRLGRLGRF